MSQSNTTITGELVVKKQRFGIVVSRFNEFITSKLLGAAIDTLERHGAAASNITTVWVPGAWEIPPTAKRLAGSGRFDAVICLGCVIRGDTSHYDHVCQGAARGIAEVGLSSDIPVVIGVLTTETLEQAINRAGAKAGNKGVDAAMTAIEMANLYAKLDAEGK